MDLVTIIGLIGSIVTLEEAGRNWIPMIHEYKKGKESNSYIPFSPVFDNESVRYAIDKFEASVCSQYGNYLFNEDEINTIIEGFFSKNNHFRLSSDEKKLLEDCIRTILNRYNDDTLSKLSLGEQLIWKKVDRNSETLSKIDKKVIGLVRNKQNDKSSEQYCWINNDEIQKRGEKTVKDIHLRNFLLGNQYNCNLWGLVFQGKTVWRDIVDDLLKKLEIGGVFALTGPGGEGKTTALMQLCVDLINTGKQVLFYHGYRNPFIPEDTPDNAVFVIDNPPNTNGFKNFLFDIIDHDYSLVIGSRDNEWYLLKKSLDIPDAVANTVYLPTLSYRESDDFANCICDNMYHKKNREEIKRLFSHNSYGFLYAAMLLSISDKNSLEEIAHQIVETLSKRSKKGLLLLSHIVACEENHILFNHSMFREMCARLSVPMREAHYAISREVIHNGNYYQTRHEVISKLFYKELFSEIGILTPTEVDDVIINLFEYWLTRLPKLAGRQLRNTQSCILNLCLKLHTISYEAQQYIIDRIIEEKFYNQELFLKRIGIYLIYEIKPLLYQKCFDHEIFIPELFQKWCKQLIRSGLKWGVLKPYYPTWIYRQACLDSYNAPGRVWKDWGKYEKYFRGPGSYEQENSARWIYREACINKGIDHDGKIWKDWAYLELETTGDGNYNVENTTRWIYREACKNRNVDHDGVIWRNWASLEEKYGMGDYNVENTARWIYAEGCIYANADKDGKLWKQWAKFEEAATGYGEYNIKNSARWIFREACYVRNIDKDGKVWEEWASLEKKASGIGDYSIENSTRWIYREACINRKLGRKGRIWYQWASLEKHEGNIGDSSTENCATWIFSQGMQEHPMTLYKDYALFLLDTNEIEKARELLRKHAQTNKEAYIYLLFLEDFLENTDCDDQFSTQRIVRELKSLSYDSINYRIALYYYYCLVNDINNAEREWRNIESQNGANPRSSSIEEFISITNTAFGSKRQLNLYHPKNEY